MAWFSVPFQPSAIQLVTLALSAIVTVNAVRRFIRSHIERKGHPLPPGPTPLPLVGSVPYLHPTQPWLTYTAWRAKYGDIMYIRLIDSDVIVLNSRSEATELLDKRSQIYSDRPFIATIEPYGQGANIGFARYGPHWRLARRIIHQTFRAEAALAFRPMQLRRARQIVINVIDNPKAFYFHFQTFGAAVAMSSIYGYEPQPKEDPLVKIIEDFCKASLPAVTPEKAILLKTFPFLLSVPEWIPGLSYIRREASKAYTLGMKVIETPYQLVQKRMAAKEYIFPDTMVYSHTQRMQELDGSRLVEYEKALKHASLTGFLAGADTTSSTLMTFTLAMVMHPRVWQRAQAEIDSVIGTDRFPASDDRSSLPYVEAVMREVMRWKPAGPLGVPHATTQDDIYKGYYIPRGATVLANIWAMSRDETRYPNPEAFLPERYLNPDGTLNDDDPADIVFGFGRRRCAGRHIADASVWSGIVTMLATIDFNPIKDEHGNHAEFEVKYVNGITHHPVQFPCNLTPRAHVTREALQDSLAKVQTDDGQD